jgi:hypothetical protein
MSEPDAPDPTPAPDPWKGFRGVVAAVLVLEALSVLFGLMVVTKVPGNGGSLGMAIVLVLAVAHVVLARYLARPWGLRAVAGLQVAVILSGVVVPLLAALGMIFGLVWVALWFMRRDVARRMVAGQLPSQQR